MTSDHDRRVEAAARAIVDILWKDDEVRPASLDDLDDKEDCLSLVAAALRAADALTAPAVLDEEALTDLAAEAMMCVMDEDVPFSTLARAAVRAICDALAKHATPAVPDELRRLSEAATPGPWHVDEGHSVVKIQAEAVMLASFGNGPYWEGFSEVTAANAALVVATVNHVRAMLSAAPSPPQADELSNYERLSDALEAEIDAVSDVLFRLKKARLEILGQAPSPPRQDGEPTC